MDPIVLIIVANTSKARIFTRQGVGTMEELDGLCHPASRMHERDLGSDRPGKSYSSNNRSVHSVGTENGHKKHEAELFAIEIAKYMKSNAGKYDSVVLMANARFAAEIEKHEKLSGITVVHSDMVHAGKLDIIAHVPAHLFAPKKQHKVNRDIKNHIPKTF